ncbi:MAG: ABC transporter permease [Ignavibacteriales bacterium]|nr:ABC transporter permease [Ignavibacteriales bacterium]
MNYRENILIGIAGLQAHKLRSALTALGIIFGVAAVVAMLSIGEGARQEALEQIRLMGMNNIIIRTKAPTAQSMSGAKANFSPGLDMMDAQAILDICPLIESAIGQWEKTSPIQFGTNRRDVRVIGTTPDFLSTFGYRVIDGSFLMPSHLTNQDNVCVIGSDVRKSLLQFAQPIGAKVKIDDQWFTVIGVMDQQLAPNKKMENVSVRNVNVDVYIPLSTAQYKLDHGRSAARSFSIVGQGRRDNATSSSPADRYILDQLTIKVARESTIEEATTVVRRILERRHFGVDDYEIVVPEALVRQSQETQRIFNIVMGAIAGISLLVGGIGIMNIMLASVMERTREIGIRRAIGATRSDVLSQFLFEAVFLSFVGGLIGIILGYTITMVITLYAGWRTVVSISSILLAFGVSAAVGIVFGYYPARQAAYKDPIESLRYE